MSAPAETHSATFRARWVLPIDRPPIDDGWVTVENGVIRDLGQGRPAVEAVTDLGDAVILPGLVNAHTHLELSWLAGHIPPASSMAAWIRGLMAARSRSPRDDVQRVAAAAALADARAQGTVAFGDISNTLLTAAVLRHAAAPSVLFHELLGFQPVDVETRASTAADRVMGEAHAPVAPGLAPHAPYSTSPELFVALGRERAGRRMPGSVHLGESPEEVEFLMTGGGPMADMLKDLGVWRGDFVVPRCDPVEYLDRLGVLTPGLLVVHGTQLREDALGVVAERGCVLVSCPRSNRWVGAGDPPLDAFFASGAPVALGTDSLASVDSLDMFAELAAARRISSVSDATLIESATRGGAVALGLGGAHGRIAPGARGPLLAVRMPAGIADVQEYLVAGEPREMQWVG